MQRYADRFDAAEQVRIVGAGTDLTLSIAGRSMKVDAGGANIPGGEFFCSPVEDSAEGEITFAEFPAVMTGRDVVGVHLRFEGGKVVDASAEVNEDFLLETLDTDEGARYLGELGIGCNPGITRHTRNILFDEKIDGTVHLALGNGIHDIGGTNVSSIHWDIVKDLRPGGRIELDGELGAGERSLADLSERSLLRRRPVVALLAAEVVSTTGAQMTWLALPWFVLVTTGSATRMSFVVARRAARARRARAARRRAAAPDRRLADDGAVRRRAGAADARDPGAALGRRRRLRRAAGGRLRARGARRALLRGAEGDRARAARRGRGGRRPARTRSSRAPPA